MHLPKAVERSEVTDEVQRYLASLMFRKLHCVLESSQALYARRKGAWRIAEADQVLAKRGRLPVVFWEPPLKEIKELKVRSGGSQTTEMVEVNENREAVTPEVESDTVTDVGKSIRHRAVPSFQPRKWDMRVAVG